MQCVHRPGRCGRDVTHRIVFARISRRSRALSEAGRDGHQATPMRHQRKAGLSPSAFGLLTPRLFRAESLGSEDHGDLLIEDRTGTKDAVLRQWQ